MTDLIVLPCSAGCDYAVDLAGITAGNPPGEPWRLGRGARRAQEPVERNRVPGSSGLTLSGSILPSALPAPGAGPERPSQPVRLLSDPPIEARLVLNTCVELNDLLSGDQVSGAVIPA